MFLSILAGYTLGLVVSIFNHILVVRVARKMTKDNREYIKGKMMLRYLIRYFINLLVLFSLYKNVPMLISAAVGLTSVKNYLFIKYILDKKGGE